jgi:7-cyano-7-deazaguanine synthase
MLTLVLSSGGLDSTTALALACSEGAAVETLFVDYGQGAASAEDRASAAVAGHYGVCRRALRLGDLEFGAGEIRGRNALLLHIALLVFPAERGSVVLGIHAGTPYRDCSPEFVTDMGRSYDFHTAGTIALAAPFVDTDKGGVYSLAADLDVPVALTHSCEQSDVPCGRCLSCQDRLALDARA